MRKLQKIFAVSATTAMTLAMGVSAFADTTVTYHFYILMSQSGQVLQWKQKEMTGTK